MNALGREQKYQLAFDEVRVMVKRKRYSAAVRKILDVESQRLRTEFRFDANHSWYFVGDLYTKMDDHKAAIPAFRRALRNWPMDVDALWAIGDCYTSLGSPRFSERYYRRAYALRKGSAELIYNLANTLLDQNRFDEAILMYRKIRKGSIKLHELAQKNLAIALTRKLNA
jgi:tetratricopeptide (TPR) repeat protein